MSIDQKDLDSLTQAFREVLSDPALDITPWLDEYRPGYGMTPREVLEKYPDIAMDSLLQHIRDIPLGLHQ